MDYETDEDNSPFHLATLSWKSVSQIHRIHDIETNKVLVSNALTDLAATNTKTMKESEKAHKAEVSKSAAHDAEKLATCEIDLSQIVKRMLREDSEKDDVAALKAANETLTTQNNALIQDKTTLTDKMELAIKEFDTICTENAASLKNIKFQSSYIEMITLDRIQVNQHNAAVTEMPVSGKAGTSKTAEDGSSVEQHDTKRNVDGMKKGDKEKN